MEIKLFDNTYYSIVVYQHKEKKTLLISPHGFNKHGIRCVILDVVKVVEYPYNEEEIGKIVKECFNIAIKRKYTEDNLMIKKGEKQRGPRTVSKEKSEKNFIENYHHQVVFFIKEMDMNLRLGRKARIQKGTRQAKTSMWNKNIKKYQKKKLEIAL